MPQGQGAALVAGDGMPQGAALSSVTQTEGGQAEGQGGALVAEGGMPKGGALVYVGDDIGQAGKDRAKGQGDALAVLRGWAAP